MNRTTLIASPLSIATPTYDRGKALDELRRAGVSRVYLVGGSPLQYDRERQRAFYARLAEETKFFQGQGLEVWYWRWALWMDGEHPFTRVVSFRTQSKNEVCPLDPAFQAFVRDDLRAIACTGVDGMLYDDDFRFDNGMIGVGCLCERHLKLAEEKLGRPIPREGLEQAAFHGRPSPLRDALLAAWGESLEEFARLSRAAIDEVNPAMRFGMCACLTSYDADGTTPDVLAKILAGPHRPYLRLIGAPYWASKWSFKIRLPEIIEYERTQRGFLPDDIEVFAEGDPYPRPRFNTPASHLELFDSALRFCDGFDGIQKYMFDYTSSADYETGYLDMHLDNQPLYRAIAAMTDGLHDAGIRVWQEQHLLAKADFSDIPDQANYIDGPLLYPQAAWALAATGIPAVHRGDGRAAIVFGESARTLPEEFRSRPVILDIQAARILAERGWDIGLQGSGARVLPQTEEFPSGERIQLLNRKTPGAREVTLDPRAEVLSRFPAEDIPASWRFHAPGGGDVLGFNFEATASSETSYRNYMRPMQIRNFLDQCGAPLPAAVDGRHPDLYLQCKTGPGALAVGLWNCSADYAKNVAIALDRDYRYLELVGATGRLDGRRLVIDRLDAFTFAVARLTR